MKTDKLTMEERMKKILEDDQYLTNLIQEDFINRKKHDLLFEEEDNIMSLLDYLKTGSDSDLSLDWHAFLKNNPFMQGMMPGIREEYKKKLAETVLEQGIAAHDQKDFENAITFYSKAIEIEPNFVTAYFNRGSANISLKKYQKAEEDFASVLRIEPAESLYNSLIKEFKDFPRLTESGIRKSNREKFVKDHVTGVLVKGNVELVRNVMGEQQTGQYKLTVVSPLDGFISLQGIIRFTIKIEALNSVLENPENKVELNMFPTKSHFKIPSSFMLVNIGIKEKEVFLIDKEIQIGDDGVYNWYVKVNDDLAWQGMFQVWFHEITGRR